MSGGRLGDGVGGLGEWLGVELVGMLAGETGELCKHGASVVVLLNVSDYCSCCWPCHCFCFSLATGLGAALFLLLSC